MHYQIIGLTPLLILLILYILLIAPFTFGDVLLTAQCFFGKKDLFNIYENELHPKNVEEHEGIKDYTQFDGLNDDWEEFNERDLSKKKAK